MRYAALLLCMSFCIIGASSCSRKKDDLFRKVDADIFLMEQVPEDVCQKTPELADLGIYRKIKCTESARVAGLCSPTDETYEEFISYCNKAVKSQVVMHKDDFKKWVDLARERIDECF